MGKTGIQVLGAGVGLLGLLGVGAGAWLVVQVRQESARWPELSEVPPPHASAPLLTDDGSCWEQMSAALASRQASTENVRGALAAEGRPDVTGAWEPDAEALARLEALSCEGLTLPPMTLDGPAPDTVSLLALTESRMLRAWDRAASAELSAAIDDLLGAAEVGRLLAEGDSTLVGAMVGIRIQEQAARELREVLTEYPAEDALLARAQADWPRVRPGLVARALASESASMEHLMAALPDVVEADLGLVASLGGYDQETTLVWHRLYFQQLIDQAERPADQREPVALPVRWASDSLDPVQYLHNPAGRILLEIAVPNMDGFIEKGDDHFTQQQMLAVWLAATHDGALPTSASELSGAP